LEEKEMRIEDLAKYEIGKEYLFKVSSRKKRIRGILIDKECYFTGYSLYCGTEAIKFKNKRGTIFTLSVYGIDSIE
jgi:hypothetical protein